MATAKRNPKTAAFDRVVFRALYATFGASADELADQVEATVDRTRAALKRLEAAGVAASQDVNDEAQAGRRRGSYKSLAWVSQPSHDDATAEEAESAFCAAYGRPTLEDDEATDAPATKKARERKKTNAGQSATDEPVLPGETPETYGDDRAAFLRDHIKSLGRSEADRAEKTAAKAELAKLDGDSKPREKRYGDLPGSKVRKCHCTGCGAILRMSPAAEQTAGGLPSCACGGSFVRSNVSA